MPEELAESMKASTQAGAVTFVLDPPVGISRASSWTYACRCIPDNGRISVTGHIDVQGEGESNDLVLKVRLKLASGEDFKGEVEGLSWSERAGRADRSLVPGISCRVSLAPPAHLQSGRKCGEARKGR